MSTAMIGSTGFLIQDSVSDQLYDSIYEAPGPANLLDSDAIQLYDSDGVILFDDSEGIVVGINLQTLWDLTNNLQVSKDLQTLWDVINLEVVGISLQSIWNIGGAIRKDFKALWDILELILPPPTKLRSKLEIIRIDQILDVSNEVNYVHEGNSGFGMPPLHRLSERGPLQDGITDLGMRLDSRIIQLVLSIVSTNWDDQYRIRKQLLNYLSPAIKQPIQLRFTQPDGTTVRQIDCYPVQGPLYEVGLETTESLIKIGFSLLAPDPVWYDPIRIVQTIQTGGGSVQGFDQPLHVPMFFGESALDLTVFINYPGTWSEYPVIEIYGQIQDPVIENLDTNEKLDFTGLLISPGDSYIIDLRYGYKTVTDNEGVNKIEDLTFDSDLTSFHLQPGFNNLHFTGTDVDAVSKFIVRYYRRYLGV